MDNTQLIELFRQHLNPEAVLLPLLPGPASLGGPNEQHLNVHFKLDQEGAYDKWAPVGMRRLAEMFSHSFPSDLQMWQLDDPKRDCEWNVIEDPEVCIREYRIEVPELWTEPAEDLTDEQLLAFTPRKKWDDHTRCVFEIVFKFGVNNETMS